MTQRTHKIHQNKQHSFGLRLNILNKGHECGKAEQTTELFKTCNKGIKTNCWESFFIHVLQQQDVLIEEQRVNDLNPLYALAHVTRQYTTYSTTMPTASFSSLSTSTLDAPKQGKSIASM